MPNLNHIFFFRFHALYIFCMVAHLELTQTGHLRIEPRPEKVILFDWRNGKITSNFMDYLKKTQNLKIQFNSNFSSKTSQKKYNKLVKNAE